MKTMTNNNLTKAVAQLSKLGLALGAASAALLSFSAAAHAQNPAQAYYAVTVNTATLVGQTGYVDMDFLAGNTGQNQATAHVTNLSGAVANPLSTQLSGEAAGDLTSAMSLGNDPGYNDLFEQVVFGSTLTFTLDFTGAATALTSAPFGSEFAFSLYDSTGSTPLLTSSADGSLVDASFNPDGTFTITSTSPSASPVVVPEPSAWAAFAVGAGALLTLGLIAARRRNVSLHA